MPSQGQRRRATGKGGDGGTFLTIRAAERDALEEAARTEKP
jgi:hypothetical protein